MENFYSDIEIQDLQKKLFKCEISSEEYLENLIDIAIKRKDNPFAQFLLYSLLLTINS